MPEGYVRAIAPIVGSNKDIPAPDINTNEQIMAWMYDEYCNIQMYNDPAFITGKSVALGGLEGRQTATALGVVTAVEEALTNPTHRTFLEIMAENYPR